MAFFGVTREIISEVKRHPNADKLDLCRLKGIDFQFVTGREQFKEGDEVIYFPIDALIPQPILQNLGLDGRLSGKEKNKVRTVKLRGEISQGIVGDKSLVPDELRGADEITTYLGVTKYEPPVVPCKSGLLVPLPEGQTVYDLEGCDRYPDVAENLMNIPVTITEKLEGQNFSITKLKDGTIFVNQRNYSIRPTDGGEHDLWKAARTTGLLDLAQSFFENHHVVIYGEALGPGIQGNYYGLKDHTIKVFDIMIDGEYLPGEDFLEWFFMIQRPELSVPVLAKGVNLKVWLNGKTIKDASNGKSLLVDKLREGIVIKPHIREYHNDKIGRLILKQRSPEYLAKEAE
jgi:RNA ligase (TIGR02306 family)